MTIEEVISENTAAVKALTAIMAGKPVPPAPTDGKRPPGRPRAVTLEEVKAIAYRVKAEKSNPVAVALIKEHGADSLANLDKSKYAAFIAAAEVLLNEPDEPGEAGDDDEL